MSKHNTESMKQLIFLILIGFVLIGIGCERLGTVEVKDCRELVVLKEEDTDTYFHKFTCNINKTVDDKIMNGICVRVELTDDGTCTKAYVYEKEPAKCTKENPYLDKDGKCYQEWDTDRVNTGLEINN